MQIFSYDVFDDIDGTTLRELSELVSQSEPGDQLNLNISSYGGEIFMALAVIDLIKDKQLHTCAQVFGLAASSAAVLALACDKVIMSPNASMLIHSAWSDDGEIDDGIRRCNSVQLEIIQKRNPKLNEKLFNQDNWYSAEDCLKLGLCDELSVDQYEHLSARYCASCRRSVKMAEVIDNKDVVEQEEQKQAEEAPVEEEQKQQEEPQAEEPAQEAGIIDVVEKLAERVNELEQRLHHIEHPEPEQLMEAEAEDGGMGDQERIDAVMKSLCRPQACLAVGAQPVKAAVMPKVNKAFLNID